MTGGEIALAALILCAMTLSFYGGYYLALKQVKEAVRYVKQTQRLDYLRKQNN